MKTQIQQDRIQQAVALLKKYHSCCTAVFATCAPKLGIDETLAARLTQGMPSIGLSGNVCGAVNGAALVISLFTTHEENFDDWNARQMTSTLIQELVTRFEARYHSTQCRDILGHDISSPEKFIHAREQGYFTLCPEVVEHAMKTLDEILSRA
ncbi:MAG: C-GCAxxG-C-C family protein [Anaerolineae bacterium]